MSEVQATAAEVKVTKINEELKLEDLPVVEGHSWVFRDLNTRATKKVDAEGNPVLDDKGNQVTEKNPAVRIPLSIATFEALVAAASQDEKVRDMLIGLVTDEVYRNAKDQVEELFAAGVTPTADKFDYDKLTIHAVALEYASSGRKGIAEEAYTAFLTDIGIFWAEANTEEGKIKARIDVFKRKFAPIKANKDLCGAMRNMLAQFVSAKPELAVTHSDVIKAYDGLLERYVTAQEKDLAASLL